VATPGPRAAEPLSLLLLGSPDFTANITNFEVYFLFVSYLAWLEVFPLSYGPSRSLIGESRGIALLLSVNLGTRWGGWSAPRPGRLVPGKDPVPVAQEAGWSSKPVWIGAENLVPSGIRFPDLPAARKYLTVPISKQPSLYLQNILRSKNNFWKLNFRKRVMRPFCVLNCGVR
jgi:hypothetical protein